MDSQDQITYLGRVDHRNKLTKFGIKPRDRTKHMYIIGKTGTGKSTFLENMIVQDIQNGHGVAFIDPHGGSASKLLDYIPEWRLNDVIYFDPSDFDYPLAFNPLEDPGPEKRHLVSDGLMSVFKKVWPDAFSGRMEYILNTVMMSLLEFPDSTVLSINRMLTDKDFRKRVVASVTDSAVRNAWDELMKWDDKRWSEAVAALINKVGQFSTNPVIRNILGQPKSTFDFRKAMDERKIIIMNLSKGMIGEQNAPLLGAMLITKIYLAAMSRAELSGPVIEKAAPFYFYVDEFQNFANESFASILSEARKYKLCLTVANQFIAQMEETIRDAVFGNMGTTVAFRVGPLDAEFMEKIFTPVFTQDDLQNIAFRQFYITLQIDNMGSKPFSAQSLEMLLPLQNSMREQVIERSRTNFGRPRAEVEESVKEFFGYGKKDGAKTISTTTTSPTPRKTIPPMSKGNGTNGVYKKPVNTPKSVQKTSSTLTDLLSKLDTAVEVKEEKPQAPVKAFVEKPVETPKPVVQPVQVVTPQTPVAPKPYVRQPNKELTRAASPEKKSALQEALARAMAGKTAPQPEKPTEPAAQNPTPEPVQTPQSLAEPRDSSSWQEERTRTTESDSSVPPLTKRGSGGVFQTKTIREVPEDILRKALE
jgi:DNA segregation ATPase FtsK/SpoIIIE-like protein